MNPSPPEPPSPDTTQEQQPTKDFSGGDPTKSNLAPPSEDRPGTRQFSGDYAAGPVPAAKGFPFLSPPQAADEIGRLGGYRVLEKLGEGGMGFVFRAEDPALQRLVALKVMRPEVAARPHAADRFLREGRAAAKIKSDHVVTVFQAETANGVPYLAMEYLDGLPLDAWLRAQKKAVPVAHALRVARDTLRGLAVAHEKGLVHRDIKPANLWLERSTSRVKILDFGLTRTADADLQLTQQGAVLGTPAYMAPEQAAGETVDVRADLFSVGAVLYTVLAGKNPFAHSNVMETLKAVRTHAQPPVAAARGDVPKAYSDFVDRLLAKDPGGRPAHAKAALLELAAIEKKLADGQKSASGTGLAVPVVAVPAPAAPPPPAAPAVWGELTNSEGIVVRHPHVEKPRSSHAVPLADGAERPPSKTAYAIVGGAAAVLAVVAGVAVALMSGGGAPPKTEGETARTDPPKPAAAPPKADPPKRAVKPPPAPKFPPLPAFAFTPVPAGRSPFDKLDAAAIPPAERFDWQPTELVAVLGSQAHHGDGFMPWGTNSAFSPDGKLLVTGGRTLIGWDADTAARKWTLTDLPPYSWPIGFRADGARLYTTSGSDCAAFDLTADGPRPTAVYPDGMVKPLLGNINQPHLLEGGATLAAVGGDGRTLVLFDLTGPEAKKTAEIPGVSPEKFCAVPQRNQLFYHAADGKFRRATVKAAKVTLDEELPLPADAGVLPWRLTASADGKLFSYANANGFLFWDVAQAPAKRLFRMEPSHEAYQFSPDGRWLAGAYNEARFYRLGGGDPRYARSIARASDGRTRMAFSPDGRRAAVTSWESLVQIADLTGEEPKEVAPPDFSQFLDAPTAVDAKAGRVMAPHFGGDTGRRASRIWDLTGSAPRRLEGEKVVLDGQPVGALGGPLFRHDPGALAVDRLTPSGDGYAAAGDLFPTTDWIVPSADGTLLLRKPQNVAQVEGYDTTAAAPKKIWTLDAKELQTAVPPFTLSPRKAWLAYPYFPGVRAELALDRLVDGKPTRYGVVPLTDHLVGNRQFRLAFSPDEQYLCLNTDPGGLSLWDLRGNEPTLVTEFRGRGEYNADAGGLAYHPGGKKLAVASTAFPGVAVLDLPSGEVIWSWAGPVGCDGVTWAADGRHLFVHTVQRTIYVLRLSDGALVPDAELKWAPAAAATTDLLALPEKGTAYPDKFNRWFRRGGKWVAAADSGRFSVANLPVTADGSYTVTAEVSPDAAPDTFGLGLPVGKDKGVFFLFSGYGATTRAFILLQGLEANDPKNPTHTSIPAPTVGRRYKVALTVKHAGDQVELSATVDDQKPIRWAGPMADLGLKESWGVAPGVLSLLSMGGPWTVHQLKIEKAAGEVSVRTPTRP